MHKLMRFGAFWRRVPMVAWLPALTLLLAFGAVIGQTALSDMSQESRSQASQFERLADELLQHLATMSQQRDAALEAMRVVVREREELVAVTKQQDLLLQRCLPRPQPMQFFQEGGAPWRPVRP